MYDRHSGRAKNDGVLNMSDLDISNMRASRKNRLALVLLRLSGPQHSSVLETP